MKVVLLKDYNKLGKKGEIKNVSNGFARNLLFPNKIAVLADNSTIEKIKKEKLENIKQEKDVDQQKKQFIQKISGQELVFNTKASKTGTLFSALNKDKIIEKINKLFKYDLKDDNIILDEPIKKVGEYETTIILGNNQAKFKIIIKSKNE